MFLERLKIIFINRINCTLYVVTCYFLTLVFDMIFVTICFTSGHLSHKFMNQFFLFLLLSWISDTKSILMLLGMRWLDQILITLSLFQYFLHRVAFFVEGT